METRNLFGKDPKSS